MRSILCPADAAKTLDDRVETALALARLVDGHVAFDFASPFGQMIAWEPFGGAALTAQVIDQARDNDRALASALEARLAPQDVPFDVEMTDAGRIEGVTAAARYADVIVMGLSDPVIEEIVLGTHCPVLAIPDGVPLLRFDVPMLVAWDGGNEGARAMRASVPLLRMASAVHLVVVRDDDEPFAGAEAASYLSRHGIHAEVHAIKREGTAAAMIEATAHELGAGLIVMGLFGKSRLREMVLGGVSRAMLDHSRIPLLLAH
ncbi:universal stress protein [Novosphingobium sp. Chol11]|uniref:universal stress protein n=1 Tax=Novosphingobium sp. Chol11 TaxID=1385763 RepID=UPI0025FED418|nr:universal stress protein [Novosphingobium sp. Chol11]